MSKEERATAAQQQASDEKIAQGRYDTDKNIAKKQLKGPSTPLTNNRWCEGRNKASINIAGKELKNQVHGQQTAGGCERHQQSQRQHRW